MSSGATGGAASGASSGTPWGAIIGAGLGMGQQWSSNPNQSIGGQGGLGLQNYDRIGNWVTAHGGDPLNLYGNKNNPNALLFPSGSQDQAGSTFPNLGAASLIPKMPGGSFQPLHNGSGPYNNMAAQGAGGMTFNPSVMPQMANPAMHQMPHNMGQQIPNGPMNGNKPSQAMAVHGNPNIRKR